MKAREVEGHLDEAQTKRYRKGDYEVNNLSALTSLRGGPTVVFEDYVCFNNPKLESLEHGPEIVLGQLHLERLPIKSLKGGPTSVARSVTIDKCIILTTLEGFPVSVGTKAGGGNQIKIKDCPSLSSLKGVPKHVPGSFWLNDLAVESLEHGPAFVDAYYAMFRLPELRSLRHLARVKNKVIVNKCDKLQGYLLAFATGADHVTVRGDDFKIEMNMPEDVRTIFRAKLHLVLNGRKDIAFIQ